MQGVSLEFYQDLNYGQTSRNHWPCKIKVIPSPPGGINLIQNGLRLNKTAEKYLRQIGEKTKKTCLILAALISRFALKHDHLLMLPAVCEMLVSRFMQSGASNPNFTKFLPAIKSFCNSTRHQVVLKSWCPEKKAKAGIMFRHKLMSEHSRRDF